MQRPSGNVPSGDGEHGEMAPERIEEAAGAGGRQEGRGTTLHRVCGLCLKAGEMENLCQCPAGERNRAGCWTEITGRTGKHDEWSGGHDPGERNNGLGEDQW